MGNTLDNSKIRHTAGMSRRGVLAAGAVGVAAGLVAVARASVLTMPIMNRTSKETTLVGGAIRPFRVGVPDKALVDLRRRIAATRWPDRETVPDRSQGAQLATMQALVQYWGSGLRLAHGGGEAQCVPAVPDHHRRARHPLHPCPLASSERLAADHDPWLARLRL